MRCIGYDESVMRDLAILFIHLVVTVARLFGPGGARSVIAESLLVKHQLRILSRSRARAPDLRPSDRVIVGLCAILMRPTRLLRSAIVLKPSTILGPGSSVDTPKTKCSVSAVQALSTKSERKTHSHRDKQVIPA